MKEEVPLFKEKTFVFFCGEFCFEPVEVGGLMVKIKKGQTKGLSSYHVQMEKGHAFAVAEGIPKASIMLLLICLRGLLAEQKSWHP